MDTNEFHDINDQSVEKAFKDAVPVKTRAFTHRLTNEVNKHGFAQMEEWLASDEFNEILRVYRNVPEGEQLVVAHEIRDTIIEKMIEFAAPEPS